MKIEKNIPMPNTQAAYGWEKFKIGDSAFFEGSALKTRMSAYQYGPRHGKKFTVRSIGNDTRIWRIL